MKVPTPDHDPFDHRQCEHPTPVFTIDIGHKYNLDLVRLFHMIWLALNDGDFVAAMAIVEDTGRFVEMAALGMRDVVDGEIFRYSSTHNDLKTLGNPDVFDAELRKLLDEDK